MNKLYNILESGEHARAVGWGRRGDYFVIKDVNLFEKDIVINHFKHGKLSSFVRQLNMHSFNKVRNPDCECYAAFKHKFFRRYFPELLTLIRKAHEEERPQLQLMSSILDSQSMLKINQNTILVAELRKVVEANDKLIEHWLSRGSRKPQDMVLPRPGLKLEEDDFDRISINDQIIEDENELPRHQGYQSNKSINSTSYVEVLIIKKE